MKVYIDSYNNVMQHDGGGVPMRIQKFLYYFKEIGLDTKLFDKWNDKISDCDVLHEFKANIDSFSEISYAKMLGKKVVLSSVIPQENALRIRVALSLKKIIPFNNTYSYLYEILRMADAVVAQTEKEKAFIVKHYKIDGAKIHVIPNGVNERILESYNPNAHKDILLCVGRFDSNKNQLNLIKALRYTDYQCHFVGGEAIDEPGYYKKCQEAAERNPNIHFHGWLKSDSKEFLDLYSRARVVALVSHKEIFGNSLIEGAACGANLLATDVLPIEEWGFSDTCVKVDTSDVNKLREGVNRAFTLPLDSRLHERTKELFAWQNIALRHQKLYAKLLEK